jgi:hypothetical protein
MVPKLKAAAQAASAGVGEVIIGAFAGGPLEEVTGSRVARVHVPPIERAERRRSLRP